MGADSGSEMQTMAQGNDEELLHAVLRLNATVTGLVTGLVTGTAIFVATNWLVFKGGPVVGPHLALLGQFFFGYSVTFVGSLIGFAYGFASGFVAGIVIGWVYNRVASLRT